MNTNRISPATHKRLIALFTFFVLLMVSTSGCFVKKNQTESWIRINQLGYVPEGIKVAVWASIEEATIQDFALYDAKTNREVFRAKSGKNFGAYGPFSNSYRLDFSSFKENGEYYLKAGTAKSPVFKINASVYEGTADFVLRYMRQQRSGFNPFLQDSCHIHDGYTMYGPMADSTLIDVSGGWHDASDYLQYVTTSANATYHLLAAYRDFKDVFSDKHLANGLEGSNNLPDVLDEARWGLEWLLKMHPKPEWMFNQLADDRDHANLRLPTKDSVDYGMGPAGPRPVYFVTGEPQGLGKYQNRTTGKASTAGKFASAFALASQLYQPLEKETAELFRSKALSAYQIGRRKPGVMQTAPNRAPYFYEEDNWTDDMQLGAAALWQLTQDDNYYKQATAYAKQEPITPWMGADTARHYQWYPFHNFGHYELASQSEGKAGNEFIEYYKEGIDRVWQKAKNNAFYRGVPFIWCSNNLTTSFAIQCHLYSELSGDTTYDELKQANIDWLFGCNPWGTSMVYGLPSWGDTPVDPHSSLTYLYDYPLDGGLVDGPVSGSIYSGLIGIELINPDEYAKFQSDLAVYHDDFGDYSTNEPTMDGTASLVYLMAALEHGQVKTKDSNHYMGATLRGNTDKNTISLIFSADEFNEGKDFVRNTLNENDIKGSFFLTGNFYREPSNRDFIKNLKKEGHYLGAHSDKHLLYNDWDKRDSLLVSQGEFVSDISDNYVEMNKFGIRKQEAKYFLPPYEWYNSTISQWAEEWGLNLINFTPGTRVTADYTWPEMGSRYVDSNTIFSSILNYERQSADGMNGFIMLVHLGTDPRRTDKFYHKLPELIKVLKDRGYKFERIDSLLE